MKIFIGDKVEKELNEYFEIFKDIAFASFKEYQEICAQRGTPYSSLTRANMIRDHFKKLLLASNIIGGELNSIEESNNTFYINLKGYPITFNKLDKDKRKSKDVDDTNTQMNYSQSFGQLSLLYNGMPINQNWVTKETPLTFGYILNRIGTEIIGLYLTYQLGKNVVWHKKIGVIKTIDLNKQKDNPKTRRVR